ncbi:MAG: hypothetical protein KJZ80_08775 [Hyphomicrobiaceae bacterium]|nr:hypothetical protein [Hyphomicrobiaceae bacterium]
MRSTVIAAACLTLALGTGTALAQTGSPGGTPSTGPTSGTSGPGRSTGTSPDAGLPPTQRGLPSSPGFAGHAGGQPSTMDRLDRTVRPGARIGRPGGTDRRMDRMMSGESTDRFPPSRLLPARPGSPADAERERLQRPPGVGAEGSLSAAQRRAMARRTGADYSQRECEQIWDPGTGMNRQQWSASCRRVGERMDRLQQLGRSPEMRILPQR